MYAQSVLTYHNDIYRTGLNAKETMLSSTAVNATTFGKLFSQGVDGYIYAQPLYMPNINIAGKGVHNVVFVATEHDSVYAFDADNNVGSNASPLWQVSFINPQQGVTTVPSSDVLTSDIVPEVGITGTPVIDGSTGTLYVVAKTKEVSGGSVSYVQRLHALDVTSGAEKFGAPVVIHASVAGSGAPNDGQGHVLFSPLRQNQRCALLLTNGVVFVAWASHGDNDPYHGWLILYNARNVTQQIFAYNTTPDTISGVSSGRGGIWQAGGAPASDGVGNVFFITGNGTFDGNLRGRNFGDSFVKLGLAAKNFDYFTPFNQNALNNSDADLGSGGVMLLPTQSGTFPRLMIGGGKEGSIYLINRDNLGGFNSSTNNVVQWLPSAVGGLFSTPAWFPGTVYLGGSGDALKAFTLTSGVLSSSPASQTGTFFGFPGPTPSISSNGSGSVIVWALQNDGYLSGTSAVLHAYSGKNLAVELYNSTQAGSRDDPGPAVKFTVPTVINGKVYVGSQTALTAFGLLQ
jgi:hypothetical protein